MIEKIGNVTIDNECYPGEDLYCDGVIEDEILDIVKTNEPYSFGRVIEERKSWPVLYHLSHLRENIVDWVPVGKTDKVLEVGSGCGAITGSLAERAKSVTCVELSKKRSLINAYRHAECENVTIKLGNFQEIEPGLACDYDYIFLIGVFEYAKSYIGGETPFETFLETVKRHLADDGRIVLAIENRFGLKYWAGCREDHLGSLFDGIEGYPNGGGVRTFTRRELAEICRADGIEDYSFYYPYPDYKFMTCVYSDDRLPYVGELSNNGRNFDRDRLYLFDEKNVFDGLIREGLFPQFSNSYVLVIGKPLPVAYARFSNDRAPQYAIRTEIRRRTDCAEGLEVRKIPLTKEAQPHVRKLEETYRRLQRAYEGSGLAVNRCVMDGDEAVFDYLPGRTLEELLDDCIDQNDWETFDGLFAEYRAIAEYPVKEPVYPYDLIFSNIIISDNTWNLIDYEWVSDEKIPAGDIIARAVYCYGIGAEKRKEKSLECIREVTGMREAGAWNEAFLARIVEREKGFQKYTTGSRMSMVEIRDAIDQAVVPVVPMIHRYLEGKHKNVVQIYEDCGAGFSEERSYFAESGYEEKKTITIDIKGKPGLRAVRIDPSLDCCIVQVKKLTAGGRTLTLHDRQVACNGTILSGDTAAFATEDPNITVSSLDRTGDGGVYAELSVTRLMRETAQSIAEGAAERRSGFRKGIAWLSK